MTAKRVDLSLFKPKVVYTHGSDLDGVVCGMIARERFGKVPIVALDYDELDQVRETPCLVLDLALPAEHPLVAAALEEAGPERIEHDGETRPLAPVVIVDHHKAAWYPRSIEEPPMGVRQVVFGCQDGSIMLFHHPQRSAAAIAHEVLCVEGGELAAWVLLANTADLWREKEANFARARALTAVVHQSGFDFCLAAWQGMLPGAANVAGMGAAAAAADERANEGALRAAIASMTEEEDHVLGVCVAGSVSHVAHGVLEHRRRAELPEKPVALVIVQSLLGESSQVAVGVRGPGALEVARRFGGGGHEESAGFLVLRCGLVSRMLESVRQTEGEPGAPPVLEEESDPDGDADPGDG